MFIVWTFTYNDQTSRSHFLWDVNIHHKILPRSADG